MLQETAAVIGLIANSIKILKSLSNDTTALQRQYALIVTSFQQEFHGEMEKDKERFAQKVNEFNADFPTFGIPEVKKSSRFDNEEQVKDYKLEQVKREFDKAMAEVE